MLWIVSNGSRNKKGLHLNLYYAQICMKAKLHLVFSITIFFSCFCVYGQQGYWKPINKQSNFKSSSIHDISKARAVFSLDVNNFQREMRSVSTSKGGGKVVYLPDADGKINAFTLWETPVMHPDLAKKYPNIKSYTGVSSDGKYRVKLSSSHKGLESMVVNLKNRKQTFMEPLENTMGAYILYEKGSSDTAKDNFICETEKAILATSKTITPLVNDQLLRKFRIAVSATGEYTVGKGGTVADALAGINATITRVNEVFETDLGVTLEIIANNDQIIFTDPATDPYTTSLNAQVQSTLTSTIGEANYDVGHLFHQVATANLNNGNAGFIGAVCVDGRKGSAFSASSTPQGDTFDLDYVAHELGHQFGANHTWSFESEGTGVQAEPASGTTIMGYAGITGDNNVAPNGDSYYHYYSILQISDYLQTISCAQTMALTNSPPVLTPVGDYVIPRGTAFVLEGIASDPDVGDVLTYTWEQIDNGIVTNTTFGPLNPNGANFRSLPPTTDPKRYFPRLSEVVQGNLTQTNPTEGDAWETVSEIERNLNFAFTVRDNAQGGGQVVSDLLNVKVVKAAGPFEVTSQTANEIYQAGSVQEITWDVANTNLAPVDAQTVDIFLSLDGGLSFPITLAQNTLNDGTEEVLLPGNTSSSARIMVKARNNIFFAVNSANFTIEPSEVVLSFQNLDFEVCQPDNLVIPFEYQTFAGFNENATFSATVPAGLTSAFSPTNATANSTPVDLTLSNTNAVAPGVYDITVTATSTSVNKSVVLSVSIQDGNLADVVLLSPTNAQSGVSLDTQLSWAENPNYTNYDIEIATDIGFTNIVESASLPFTSYKATSLQQLTQYFWRVRPNNGCGTGTFGTPFSFNTTQVDCKTIGAKNLPLTISASGTPTVTTSVTYLEDLPISDVNVNLQIDHTYVEDLIVTLISPAGTRVTLFANSCGQFDNIDAVFDDDGDPILCSDDPAITGTVTPIGSLSSLRGESILGEWVLEIRDTAPSDGGALIDFSLDFCIEGVFRPDADGDGVFDDGDDLCLGTPKGVEVDASGCAVYRFASDNFNIEIESETCRSSNNGSITVTALDTALTYTGVLTGNGNVISQDFTNTFAFVNLSAGNYTLCITGTDGSIVYEEVCFGLVVVEPDILEMNAAVQSGMVQIDLSGSTFYNVELNGSVTQTQSNSVTLPLKEGLNTIRVFSNLPCQGVVEKTVFYSSRPRIFPNPVDTKTEVYLGGYEGQVGIEVFTVNGRLVSKFVKTVKGSDLELDFSALRKGVYYLGIERDGFRETFKFIKR